MNPFDKHITEFLNYLAELKGQSIHFASHLNSFSKKLKESIPNEPYLASLLAFHDPTSKEPGLMIPDYNYIVDFDNISDLTDNLIGFENNYLISQAYERLISFLKNVSSEIILLDKPIRSSLRLSTSNKMSIDFSEARKNIDEFVKLKRAKILLKLLRLYSTEYKYLEVKSNFQFNYKLWFNALTIARNIIVHSGSVIKKSEFESYSTSTKSIIKEFFDLIIIDDNYCKLRLVRNNCDGLISSISGFAYVVYKSSSMQAHFETDAIKKYK